MSWRALKSDSPKQTPTAHKFFRYPRSVLYVSACGRIALDQTSIDDWTIEMDQGKRCTRCARKKRDDEDV